RPASTCSEGSSVYSLSLRGVGFVIAPATNLSIARVATGSDHAIAIAAVARLLAISLFPRRRSRRVRRRIEDVAAVARVLVFERADFIRAVDAPLQAFDVSLPARLDVALDQRRPVEARVEIVFRADQVAVDRLFPHGQMVLERPGDEADRLLLDTRAPAGRLFRIADHVRRHAEEHGNVGAAELAALDPLRILGRHGDAGIVHALFEDQVLSLLLAAGAELFEPGLEIGDRLGPELVRMFQDAADAGAITEGGC